PGHRGDMTRMAGDRDADLAGADRAARRLDALDLAVLGRESRDLAILDNVDAAGIGRTCEAPGDGVMSRDAGARLKEGARDREARLWGEVEDRHEAAQFLARQEYRVDAVEAHAIAATEERLRLRVEMPRTHHAALTEHDVVVQLLRQPLPELDR